MSKICLQLYMPAWKHFEDVVSNFEHEASGTDENTIQSESFAKYQKYCLHTQMKAAL